MSNVEVEVLPLVLEFPQDLDHPVNKTSRGFEKNKIECTMSNLKVSTVRLKRGHTHCFSLDVA